MKALLGIAAAMLMIGALGANPLAAQRQGSQGHQNTRPAHAQPNHAPAQQYITVQERVWVPGHYTTVIERVLVPGRFEDQCVQVWVPARIEVVRQRCVDSRGRVYYTNVHRTVPGHYKTETRRVFVPAHYIDAEKRVYVPGKFEIRERKVLVDSCNTCNTQQPAATPRRPAHSVNRGNRGRR